LDKTAVIWEPACGDGAMAKVLARHAKDVISSDLREDCGYGQGGINFLEPTSRDRWNWDWIITNPPFNLAEAFIRKSLLVAPNVAVLLKSQYWHAASRLPLFTEHQPQWILPLTWRPAFLEEERGSSPLMDVIWVVWRNADEPGPTRFLPLPRPKNVMPILEYDMEDLL
jgi:hypothetical protein